MRSFNSFLLISLVLITILTSCKKDDNSNDGVETQIVGNVSSGEWRVTKFIDSGTDETSQFSGYTFTFGSNNTLTATNGSNTYTGNWNIGDSNSNDDSMNDLHLTTNFNLTNDFESLNEDWRFITQSSTKIELIHESSGNGGTDYLTLEKV